MILRVIHRHGNTSPDSPNKTPRKVKVTHPKVKVILPKVKDSLAVSKLPRDMVLAAIFVGKTSKARKATKCT